MGVLIEGVVVDGLGEGSHFMSMDHYKTEIKDKLGFEAYPGTLNIKTNNKNPDLFKNHNIIRINGFEKDSKKFHGKN